MLWNGDFMSDDDIDDNNNDIDDNNNDIDDNNNAYREIVRQASDCLSEITVARDD